ncbi:hypothetical protein B0H16DRAFT_1460956 [Mycena metata]|uniref:Uncharacterized protein n=1 Tax=Mycena metata TaxID=1033252 RepID=A0AAD7IT58_9AGAR|nr:hypothetical protein B0H16DRAFT_1460956 [Mycena metata]
MMEMIEPEWREDAPTSQHEFEGGAMGSDENDTRRSSKKERKMHIGSTIRTPGVEPEVTGRTQEEKLKDPKIEKTDFKKSAIFEGIRKRGGVAYTTSEVPAWFERSISRMENNLKRNTPKKSSLSRADEFGRRESNPVRWNIKKEAVLQYTTSEFSAYFKGSISSGNQVKAKARVTDIAAWYLYFCGYGVQRWRHGSGENDAKKRSKNKKSITRNLAFGCRESNPSLPPCTASIHKRRGRVALHHVRGICVVRMVDKRGEK